MRNYIVTWIDQQGLDQWSCNESLNEARLDYNTALEDNAHTITISAVIESTDYEPHHVFKLIPEFVYKYGE